MELSCLPFSFFSGLLNYYFVIVREFTPKYTHNSKKKVLQVTRLDTLTNVAFYLDNVRYCTLFWCIQSNTTNCKTTVISYLHFKRNSSIVGRSSSLAKKMAIYGRNLSAAEFLQLIFRSVGQGGF